VLNSPAGGSTVLDDVRNLRDDIQRRRDEIERDRALPADLLSQLSRAGCFRMTLPKSYGGEGLTLLQTTYVLAELARADASVGWTAMIAAAPPVIASYFPAETYDEVYRAGPDTLMRGAIAPKGVAIPADGGYVVSGQWPFASGSFPFQWVACNSVVLADGQPRIGPMGVPETRLALLPAEQVDFLDTWHVVGLRGTASHDFVVHEQFVPESRAIDVFASRSCLAGPFSGLPIRGALAPTHAAVALGTAQGALDDVCTLAATKRSAMNPSLLLAGDPVFQYRVGEAAMRLEAGAALLEKQTEQAWAKAADGADLTPVESVTLRATAGYVTAECVKVVDEAYTLAGSSSLYETSPLQRRLRDIHTATQHVAASAEPYPTLGALLSGQDVAPIALF
jgi:indole-3-acetate monooxygenase